MGEGRVSVTWVRSKCSNDAPAREGASSSCSTCAATRRDEFFERVGGVAKADDAVGRCAVNGSTGA